MILLQIGEKNDNTKKKNTVVAIRVWLENMCKKEIKNNAFSHIK
jgi:hypothetical protein